MTTTKKTEKKIIDPDLSEGTVVEATLETTTAVAPFLPAKVRVAIYSAAGVVAVVAGAVAPVVGGMVGDGLAIAGAAAGAVASVLAISHVTK